MDNLTQKLFDQFIKEKEVLGGLSPHTIQNYTRGWETFKKHKAEITEDGVKNFVFGMVKSGLKPGAVNSYSRFVNSFLTWLFENDHTEKHLKIPYLKTEKRVLHTYSQEDATRIIAFKPKTMTDKRTLAILHLLIDTGCRIDEALTLERKNVDFDWNRLAHVFPICAPSLKSSFKLK